jgi:radical SAM superfamily enzyme YgiQ (UPF0313 family)
MINSRRYLMRIILPAFSFPNIFSKVAKVTTSLGPICVATAANKLEKWDVEVIDENNCGSRFCPKDVNGYPDHIKLQEERPADVVGFYGSLTSTIPRLYKLAALYKSFGVKTVTGGKHVEHLPEEALGNNIDVVVLGEGENTIKDLLLAWQEGQSLEKVAGIVFRKAGEIIKTVKQPLINDFEEIPFPDFNLLRYAKLKVYPLGRIRGCNMNCEFCVVKEKVRCSPPQHIIHQIAYLVENRKARKFFETSDHFAANRDDTIAFCRMLRDYRQKVNVKISMTVQIRINDAQDTELLQAMKEAGIQNLAIGFESPIDEELRAMRKGYLSADMIRWTETLHRYGFFIHGMFIFGYPKKTASGHRLTLEKKTSHFYTFIKKAKIDTLQILLTVPLPGTELRKRLEKEGRIYSLEHIGWEYYDGQFPLFEPDDNTTPEELQKAAKLIMSKIYCPRRLLQIIINIIIHFPFMVLLSTVSIVSFRVKYIIKAFIRWKQGYFRNSLARFGGYILLKKWVKKFNKDKFLESLAITRAKNSF